MHPFFGMCYKYFSRFLSISGQSSIDTTDTSDSEFETLHIISKSGSDGKYKINCEARHALRHIAETADGERDFKIEDVDLTDFGQKIMEIDFDARTLLFR